MNKLINLTLSHQFWGLLWMGVGFFWYSDIVSMLKFPVSWQL